MSCFQTIAESAPKSSRPLISIIGKMNVGKSSLLNALVGEKCAIVSDKAGTTTDTVVKHYELIPFGPVTFYDTAGLDDCADELSAKRVSVTKKVLWRTDLAILVTDDIKPTPADSKIIQTLSELHIPFITIVNKADTNTLLTSDFSCSFPDIDLVVSATQSINIGLLKTLLVQKLSQLLQKEHKLLQNLPLKTSDTVALITPIDSSAPKDRLILPQVRVLRELLDNNIKALVATHMDKSVLEHQPALIITDSQAALPTAENTPLDIPLTSFSILFARAKGEFSSFFNGAKKIDKLKPNSHILIAESCSHNVQEDDIGRKKIPKLLQQYLGHNLIFDFCIGHDFPDNLETYDLVIHCGACMMGRTEVLRRIYECQRRGVAITNYGMAITLAQGLLSRFVSPFVADDMLDTIKNSDSQNNINNKKD